MGDKVVMVAVVGIVPQFVIPTKQEWSKFKDKLNFYFEANVIVEDNRKRAILLSSTGDLTFEIVHNAKSEKPIAKLSLEEAFDIIDTRFKTTENKYILKEICLQLVNNIQMSESESMCQRLES
jgi:hypothetical protein